MGGVQNGSGNSGGVSWGGIFYWSMNGNSKEGIKKGGGGAYTKFPLRWGYEYFWNCTMYYMYMYKLTMSLKRIPCLHSRI